MVTKEMPREGSIRVSACGGGYPMVLIPAAVRELRVRIEDAILDGDLGKVKAVIADAIEGHIFLGSVLNVRNERGQTVLGFAREWECSKAIISYLEDLGARE